MRENIIKIDNLDIYQHKQLILANVALMLNKGEFVYLIGATGSGKSSLLRILYADLPIKKGSVEVSGFELNEINYSQIPFFRRKLGIVFQDFQLLTDRTVEQNLEFVLKATGWKGSKKITNRTLEVLDHVGLRAKLKKYPHELSGGEQQRVAIARALLNNPTVILADEPTGNLDTNVSNEIIGLLKNISVSGATVIMATHDYDIIKRFPARIIKCDKGRLIDNFVLEQ